MTLGTNAIPTARLDLLRVADELDEMSMIMNKSQPADLARTIRNIVISMHRRTAIKQAPMRARTPVPPITPEMRKQVQDMAGVGYKNRVIARKLGLGDGGRVSEILHGDR